MSQNTLGIAPLAMVQNDQSGPVDGTDEPAAFSADVVFDALSDSRRRYALYHLWEVGDTVGLAELADAVAVTEASVDGKRRTEDLHQRIHTALYHRHLPLLSDQGVVEFDEDEEVVSLTETEQLDSSIQFAMEKELSVGKEE